MDDNNIYQDFINNVLGVANTQVRNEILGFLNNFSAFMAVMDKDIESFFKGINSSNSARPPNRKILIT